MNELSTIYAEIEKLNQSKLRRLEDGTQLLDLSMINPDLPPSRILMDRLQEAIGLSGAGRYSVSRGVRKLRSAFAARYAEVFDVDSNPDTDWCVTLGCKDAVLNLLILSDSDKKVLVGSPVYPVYRTLAETVNKELETFTISNNENEMLVSIEEQIKSGSFDVLILNLPNNPTGATVGHSFYEKLAPIVERHKVLAINDFTYGELVFSEERAVSMLESSWFRKNGVEIYSMSKGFSVPGWRIAGAVGSREVIEKLSRLKSQMDYGNFIPLQIAAATGLLAGDAAIKDIRNTYRERINLVSQLLNEEEKVISAPEAGCSLWINPKTGVSGMEFSRKLLEDYNIVVLPGAVFGPEWDAYVRVAMVSELDRLEYFSECFGRMKESVS